MPIYADTEGIDKLKELMKYNVCAVCGAFLTISLNHERHCDMLVCERFPEHEGIERSQSPYEREGDDSLNIETRRERMVKEHGAEKTTALDKYIGRKELAKVELTEILTTVYPKAPAVEVKRAMLLCASYNLNPLMGHVYLIPFKIRDKTQKVIGESWATVMGIKATRLLGSRRGAVSYMDDTPRLMSEAEQTKIYGKAHKGYIYAITKLRNPATKAEASGYGRWKIGDKFKGEDKGNSAENMAIIRSERQALDRLFPGEMPVEIEVVDERFMPKLEAATESKDKPEEKEPEVIDAKAEAVEEDEGKEEPEGDPSKYTVADLWAIAKENGWGPMDIGQYANSVDRGVKGGWAIRDEKDLANLTPEQIGELIEVITKNPKTK